MPTESAQTMTAVRTSPSTVPVGKVTASVLLSEPDGVLAWLVAPATNEIGMALSMLQVDRETEVLGRAGHRSHYQGDLVDGRQRDRRRRGGRSGGGHRDASEPGDVHPVLLELACRRRTHVDAGSCRNLPDREYERP